MDHFIAFTNSVIWPITIFALLIIFKKSIVSLLDLLQNIKYKNFELNFRERLAEARNDSLESGVQIDISSDEKNAIYRLAETSPSLAILESWNDIVSAGRNKLGQLIDDNVLLSRNKVHPLMHLEHTGALTPSTIRSISNLRRLRNQIVHNRDIPISKESAFEYVTLAKSIAKQIDAITELPKQKLNILTLLILEYNHLIDTGKYSHISIKDVHTAVNNKNIIGYISELTSGDSDFSLFRTEGRYSSYINFYHEQMYDLYIGYRGNERRKWGVENSGLCLLVAWTNELVQQGSGWHPYETANTK